MIVSTEVFKISDLGYRPKVKVKVKSNEGHYVGKITFLTISLDHTIVLKTQYFC